MKKETEKNNLEAEEVELDLEELDQVSGGANPFAQYKRVQNQQYDDDIRRRV